MRPAAEYPQYAYGWSFSKSPTGHRKLAHVGGNGAFQSDFRRYPEDGAMIAITSNTDDYSSIAIANHLELLLFGKPFVEPPPTRGGQGGGAEALRRRLCAGDRQAARRADHGRDRPGPPGRLAGGHGGPRPALGQAGREAPAALRRARERRLRGAGGGAAQASSSLSPAILVDHGEAAKHWWTLIKETETKLGAWTGFTMLGTRSIGGQVVTHARLDFVKGARVLDVAWAGTDADHLTLGDRLRPTFFLPEGPSRFVTYDVGTESIVHLTCEGTGPAPTLKFEGPDGTVSVKRK